MGVYVDNMRARLGRMVMCHMFADSRAELDTMADEIGVARRWIQKPNTYSEHYDICLQKRRLAVVAGAKQMTLREVGKMLVERRNRQRRRN